MLLAFAVYMCAAYVSWGCYYIQADIPSSMLTTENLLDINDNYNTTSNVTTDGAKIDNDGVVSEQNIGFVQLGLYSYPDPRGGTVCVAYEELLYRDDREEIDELFFHPAILAARGFSLIASSLTGVCFLMLCLMSWINVARAAIKFLAFLCFIGGSMELFTFVVFASALCGEYRCRFGAGCGMAIATYVLAMINTIIIYKLPRGAAAGDEEQDGVISTLLVPGQTEVTETILPDGSKRIIKITVNHDGSKTVEETTISQEQPIAQRPSPEREISTISG